MTCKVCKFYKFEQNDMLGACKRYPTVVNKAPSDWCGELIPCEYEPTIKYELVEADVKSSTTVIYDINTDEVKPKKARKKNVNSDL